MRIGVSRRTIEGKQHHFIRSRYEKIQNVRFFIPAFTRSQISAYFTVGCFLSQARYNKF